MKLFEVAEIIFSDWKTIGRNSAYPYAKAMLSLNDINDNYGLESAKSIVLYFLSNAGAWRGETARKTKNLLRKMLEKHNEQR